MAPKVKTLKTCRVKPFELDSTVHKLLKEDASANYRTISKHIAAILASYYLNRKMEGK